MVVPENSLLEITCEVVNSTNLLLLLILAESIDKDGKTNEPVKVVVLLELSYVIDGYDPPPPPPPPPVANSCPTLYVVP